MGVGEKVSENVGADDRASGGREEASERNEEGMGPIVKSRAQ